MHRTRTPRLGAIVASTLAIVLAVVLIPAIGAYAGGPLNCTAQGYAVQTPAGPTAPGAPATYNWTVQGAGLCIGDLKGPYSVKFAGAGTSTGLGLCDGLLVRDLSIDVTIDLTSGLAGHRTFDETWFAPLTTFPLATPFLVSDSGGSLIGAGAVVTRTRLACPPDGVPTAVFNWTQLRS